MKPTKRRTLWVVEVLWDDSKWEPTVGYAVTRDAARDEIRARRERNPGVKFRLVKYVRESKGGRK